MVHDSQGLQYLGKSLILFWTKKPYTLAMTVSVLSILKKVDIL